MVPEVLETKLREYWNAGFRIHVHVTGDRRGINVRDAREDPVGNA